MPMKMLREISIGFIAGLVALGFVCAGAAGAQEGGSDMDEATTISAEEMQRVYEEVRTPYKYGIVIAEEEGVLVDSPNVLRAGETWYMIYIRWNQVGYETHLARSADLLHWVKLGPVFSFTGEGWDAWQAAGSVALQDPTWGGSYAWEPFDGKTWMSYIGGAKQGYETDPLSLGMAVSDDPTSTGGWRRATAGPIMSAEDEGARPFEAVTLYKTYIVRDETRRLGAPFVMFYNGKDTSGTERIGIAVSEDMLNWRRHGAGPVIDNGPVGISGDPQVVRMGELWVMFYYGAFWQPNAFDTFACSRDLEHWTKWEGPHLIEPTEPWDRQFAHKPWVVKHEGVVYHFYCAVGDQGRAIAVATSREMGE